MSSEIRFTVADSVLTYTKIDSSIRLYVDSPAGNGAPTLLPSCRFGDFHDGIASALDCVLEGYGYINSRGLFITPMRYITAEDFSDGRAFVTDDESTKLIDASGTVLRDFGSILITRPFSEGVALVSKILNDTAGECKRDAFVDRKGEIVIPFGDPDEIVSLEIISDDDVLSDGLIRVHTPGASGRRFGFMDTAEKLRIPMMYDDAGRFVNGLAPAARKNRWGFIDKQNKTRIAFGFEAARAFSEGLASVRVRGLWGYIDDNGEFAIDPVFEGAGKFSDGTARVRVRGKYGIIDNRGEYVAPPVFDCISNFNHGICRIGLDGRAGVMNREGEMLFEG